MIVAFRSLREFGWTQWFMGLLGAAISGGAGALGTGGGGLILGGQDPDHYLLQGNHLLKLMLMTFIVSAVVSLMKYLQSNPVPEPLTVNTTGPVIVNPPAEKNSK